MAGGRGKGAQKAGTAHGTMLESIARGWAEGVPLHAMYSFPPMLEFATNHPDAYLANCSVSHKTSTDEVQAVRPLMSVADSQVCHLSAHCQRTVGVNASVLVDKLSPPEMSDFLFSALSAL